MKTMCNNIIVYVVNYEITIEIVRQDTKQIKMKKHPVFIYGFTIYVNMKIIY